MANDPAYSRLTDPPPTQLPLRRPGDVTDRQCVMPVACPVAVTLNESEVRADERQRCKADVCLKCARGDVPQREDNGAGWWHGLRGVCEASGIWEREWVESPAAGAGEG